MISGVIVGCTFHANQWRVSSGKKYRAANATSRNGTITAPRTRVPGSTRSSRIRPSTIAPESGSMKLVDAVGDHGFHERADRVAAALEVGVASASLELLQRPVEAAERDGLVRVGKS